MAVRFHGDAGGIVGLLDLLDQHGTKVWEAVEYELLTHGWHLSDIPERLSWGELIVLVKRWSRTPSAVMDALHGHMWGVGDQVTAYVYDAVRYLTWVTAGNKRAPKPKPFPRPWNKGQARTYGSDPIPAADFKQWWADKAKRTKKRKRRRDGRRR